MRLRWYCQCGEKNERHVNPPSDLFIFDEGSCDSLGLIDKCWSCSAVVGIEVTAKVVRKVES